MVSNNSGTESVIKRYIDQYHRNFPERRPPVVTKRGSWFHIAWDGHGEKSCRLTEIVRMTTVLAARP